MRNLTIKAYSACEAAEFFSKVNPFMFLGDDYPSRFRERPEWYFMDPITGKSRETQVSNPDEVSFNQDLGDMVRCDWVKPGMRRRTDGMGTYLEYRGEILRIEYAILDGGIRIPHEGDCNCFLDTNPKP